MKTNSLKNIWAHALIAWFALFISGILVFVFFAIQHPMSLVSQNYYEEELLYQARIDNTARANALTGIAVTYQPQANLITISLPPQHARDQVTGHIHLYRPSDDALDQTLALALNPEGQQQLDTTSLQPGLWKVQLQWTFNDEDFFHDQTIVTDAR